MARPTRSFRRGTWRSYRVIRATADHVPQLATPPLNALWPGRTTRDLLIAHPLLVGWLKRRLYTCDAVRSRAVDQRCGRRVAPLWCGTRQRSCAT
jgi:hypothetical protein